MTIVDKNRIKEEEWKMRVGIKKFEKERIQKNSKMRMMILENDPDKYHDKDKETEKAENQSAEKLNQTRNTELSMDSVNNNIGNLGKLIGRFVEDREQNP